MAAIRVMGVLRTALRVPSALNTSMRSLSIMSSKSFVRPSGASISYALAPTVNRPSLPRTVQLYARGISTRKRRNSKMNKHKLRKRRKKNRMNTKL